MSKPWKLFLFALAVIVSGCEPTGGHKERLERLESGVVELEREVDALQARADASAEAAPGMLAFAAEAAASCQADPHAFVRDHRGSDCSTFEWELAASSRRCVTDCDDNARYAEAAASGQAKCEELCAARNCPRGRFTPPRQCQIARCFPNFETCPQTCSTFNSCYLAISRTWNCICLEL